MNIEITKNQHTVIDGVEMSRKELAEFLGVSRRTVLAAFRKYKADEDMTAWIHKKKWVRDEGLPSRTKVFYRDNIFVTVGQIAKEAGIPVWAAHPLGCQFEKGEITYEQLLTASETCLGRSQIPQWEGLSNRNRDHNLAKIPSPTKWDKAISNQCDSLCLPSAVPELGASHRRY